MTRDTFLKMCEALENKELAGAAAARLVHQMKAHGLTWDRVVDQMAFQVVTQEPVTTREVAAAAPDAQVFPIPEVPPKAKGPYADIARHLVTHGRLTAWERGFVVSCSTRQDLTEKMKPIWERICRANGMATFREIINGQNRPLPY